MREPESDSSIKCNTVESFFQRRVAFLPHNGIAHLAPMHERICRITATLTLGDKWILNLEEADMKTSALWMIYSQFFMQQFGGRWIFDGLFKEESFITLFLRPEPRRNEVMGETDCCKVSSYWGSLARRWSAPSDGLTIRALKRREIGKQFLRPWMMKNCT